MGGGLFYMGDSQGYKAISDGYQRFPNLYQRIARHAQNKSAKVLEGPTSVLAHVRRN